MPETAELEARLGTVPSQQLPVDPTAEEWLAYLDARLIARREALMRYEEYYAGKHRLAFATSKFRQTFGDLFSAFADNWCDLIVDASVERLQIVGFHVGGEGNLGDDEAWSIWKANRLEARSRLAHSEAVITGECNLLVAPGDPEPRITVETPLQTIVESAPEDPRMRLAALKKWLDIDSHLRANVYLPDAVYKFRSRVPARNPLGTKVEWEPFELLRHPLGVVPMIPMLNNPTIVGGGQSDIAKVIPLQDAVNKLVSDMMVASEYTALPQRWATGIEIPHDPDTNEPLDAEKFLSSIRRIWTVGDPEAKFGEFPASGTKSYVESVEMLIQHIAAQTRTPPHYLLGQSGAFPSGESLSSTETGLVAKCHAKQIDFGDAWEDALRLAFRFKGEVEKSEATDLRTLWRDPESRQEGELVDALLKAKQIGVPLEALWERWGASPEEIKRWAVLVNLPERPGLTPPSAAVPVENVTSGGVVVPAGVAA